MQAQSTGPILSAVVVDYDNIYLSLKRKNEEAAKRFAKDANLWLQELMSGALITSHDPAGAQKERRIVMNRCYGNPIPRRNAHDNSTDMNSFPFVRHHFLRSGFEVIDCPPLTAQLKNSADIRMVMDVRDYLTHDTYFNEFIILSSDADFTPVLHRLRAHARRNIIFTNDHTATPYTAICDGEIRESDLLTLLLSGRLPSREEREQEEQARNRPYSSADLAILRKKIITEVVEAVRTAGQPVPLEALADRAVRALGHDKTAGTSWAGAGGFRDLLLQDLPTELSVSEQPPYFVFDTTRQVASHTPAPARANPMPAQSRVAEHVPKPAAEPTTQPTQSTGFETAAAPGSSPGAHHTQHQSTFEPTAAAAHSPQLSEAAKPQSIIQQSIARIHEASQAPPLSPPEYRVLFEKMAEEISANNLSGSQTLDNIAARCLDAGTDVRKDDIRFVLEVVSEADPWFEQGASGNLFASRFRNFVVARCRTQGLSLSANELDLVEAWFGTGSTPPSSSLLQTTESVMAPAGQPAGAPSRDASQGHSDPWWDLEEARQHVAQSHSTGGSFGHGTDEMGQDDFPRIIRSRLRN
ncbi:MAG: NYN domain-containing protein [Alphaproteobacteria bacterium]|nr:NYN domain-containing protein [Alphaproteobacteria bacterium]